jgi:hypothetical protein
VKYRSRKRGGQKDKRGSKDYLVRYHPWEMPWSYYWPLYNYQTDEDYFPPFEYTFYYSDLYYNDPEYTALLLSGYPFAGLVRQLGVIY